MNVVEFDNKTIRYACSWDELTRSELLQISRLLLQNLSPAEFKLRLIYKMLGLNRRILSYNDRFYFVKGVFRYLRWEFLLKKAIKKGYIKRFSRQDAYFLSETLNWMFHVEEKRKKVTYTLSNSLSRNLLGKIKRPRGLSPLYGPADLLRDVSAIEFAKAHVRYESYVNTGDVRELNRMVATLYRPKKKGSKLNYSDHLAERTALSMPMVPIQQRYAVFLFFQGCLWHLKKMYPLPFSQQPQPSEGAGYGWAGIFRALTDGKIADIDRVMELPIHTVLMDLNEKILTSRKLEEKLKKYEPHK